MAEERRNDEDGDSEDDILELDVDALRPEDLLEAAAEALKAVEGNAPAAAKSTGVTPVTAAAAAQVDDAEIAALQEELSDLRNRAARTLADFENFRKRSEREREDVRRYAAAEPLRELVSVADNLERALAAGGSIEDVKRGVDMIFRQIHDLLRRHSVREVEAAGQLFDPAVHEAVLKVEDPEVERPTVVDVLQRGYVIHDRLLRPAMVKVAVPASRKAE